MIILSIYLTGLIVTFVLNYVAQIVYDDLENILSSSIVAGLFWPLLLIISIIEMISHLTDKK